GGRGDPVADFSSAVLRAAGPGQARRAAAACSHVLATVAFGNLVLVEMAGHAAGVAARHETQQLAIEGFVQVCVGGARCVPEATGAHDRDAELAGIFGDDV